MITNRSSAVCWSLQMCTRKPTVLLARRSLKSQKSIVICSRERSFESWSVQALGDCTCVQHAWHMDESVGFHSACRSHWWFRVHEIHVLTHDEWPFKRVLLDCHLNYWNYWCPYPECFERSLRNPQEFALTLWRRFTFWNTKKKNHTSYGSWSI